MIFNFGQFVYDIATAFAPVLPVFLILALILDYGGKMLFSKQ